MGILNDINLLNQDDTLTDVAIKKYIDDTTLVLAIGTGIGQGPLGTDIDIQFPAGFAPKDFEKSDDLELHRSSFSAFHKTYIDNIYQSLAKFLNLDSNYLATPIIDPTLVLPKIDPNISIPIPEIPTLPDLPNILLILELFRPPFIELAIQLNIPEIDIPDFTASLILELGNLFPIALPALPNLDFNIGDYGIDIPNLDFFDINLSLNLDFPDVITFVIKFVTGVIKMFFDLIARGIEFVILVLSDIISLLNELITLLVEIIGDVISKYAMVAASMIVMIRNVTSILIIAVISQLIGSGLITKSLADILGLV